MEELSLEEAGTVTWTDPAEGMSTDGTGRAGLV
jgi:hypothetical protein